jgi:hypothetical protein
MKVGFEPLLTLVVGDGGASMNITTVMAIVTTQQGATND